MGNWLWISVIANALLLLALVSVVRRLRWIDEAAANHMARAVQEAGHTREQLTRLYIDHRAFGQAVSTSLKVIRQDINANYAHLHDDHVLGLVATRLSREIEASPGGVMELHLDDDIARQVQNLGGEVTDRGTMTLGQMLEFGWHLHSTAQERAAQLRPIVSEPCMRDGQHASWLSKTFAIYERMCDQDKELAVRRMEWAVREWQSSSYPVLSMYVEDIR